MALQVEGLGVGAETSIEEYIIGPDNEIMDDDQDLSDEKDQIKLYGPEEGLSWIARPVTRQSTVGLVSRHGSMASRSGLVDPLVTLFGSVNEKIPEAGSMRSTLFPHFGSMFSVGGGNQPRQEEWDEESLAREGEEYASDAAAGDSDDNLQSPLISRQTTSLEKDLGPPPHGSLSSMRHGSTTQEPVSSMGIGGGWQLAWKWSEREGKDGKKEGGFKRIYLHQEGAPGSVRGSLVSIPGVDATPGIETTWGDLFEPGVKHALAVGVGLQILQQFSGINGVRYYTPQILDLAGVGVLLSHLGLSSSSASLLICNDNFVDASCYSCCHEAHGCLWQEFLNDPFGSVYSLDSHLLTESFLETSQEDLGL